TIVERAERPQVAEEEENAQRQRRWPGRWSMGAIGLVVGVVLGIVLAVVSVILPRTRELARWRQGGGFFRDFSRPEVLEAAAPGRAWSVETQSDWSPWANRSSGREFLARARVVPADQSRVLSAITGRVQWMIQRRGDGQVSNNSQVTAAPAGAD